MTNGRFLSVRHRAVVNSYMSRMSIAYFGAPSPHARISCLPNLVATQKLPLYRSFTWAEFKRTTYSQQLKESRLDLFKMINDDPNGEWVDWTWFVCLQSVRVISSNIIHEVFVSSLRSPPREFISSLPCSRFYCLILNNCYLLSCIIILEIYSLMSSNHAVNEVCCLLLL